MAELGDAGTAGHVEVGGSPPNWAWTGWSWSAPTPSRSTAAPSLWRHGEGTSVHVTDQERGDRAVARRAETGRRRAREGLALPHLGRCRRASGAVAASVHMTPRVGHRRGLRRVPRVAALHTRSRSRGSPAQGRPADPGHQPGRALLKKGTPDDGRRGVHPGTADRVRRRPPALKTLPRSCTCPTGPTITGLVLLGLFVFCGASASRRLPQGPQAQQPRPEQARAS